MMENLKDRFAKWKINHIQPSGEHMVTFRRFGHKLEDHEDKAQALEEFKKALGKQTVNKKNLQAYLDSYMNRVDITGKLRENLRCDALLVVGSKSSQCAAAEYMHSHMDKVCSTSSNLKAKQCLKINFLRI